MGAPSSSRGSTLTSTADAQFVESTCTTIPPFAIATNATTTHATPQATREECRKAARFNQQHCRKLKGNAMIACYTAVGLMLAASLATAKG